MDLKVYTAKEVAEILNLKVDIVLRYIREGKLEKIKNIGHTRVTEEALEKFIKGE